MAKLTQLVQKFSIKLSEQLLSLGYQPGATDIVERAVRYFFIRYGIDVVNVGEPELTDFEFAMASFQKRDDAFFIYKSPEQLRQNFRELKLMLFIFRTVLYHQSRINDPPKRKVPVPTSL